MNAIDKIRWFVFRIWFFSIFFVLAVFAERFVAPNDVRPSFEQIFPSFQTMMGLVLPQLAIMMTFYFNLNARALALRNIDDQQSNIVVMCSVAYHLIFYVILFAGITHGLFAPGDGNGIERNAAAVSSIMSVFSLLLTPIVFLFSRPASPD